MESLISSPQSSLTSKIPKTNYLIVVLVTALICSIIFGMGGYYIGSSKMFNTCPDSTTTPVAKISEISPILTTEDATSNWKTYTSKLQNFSFKIPKEFVVSETKDGIDVFLDQQALDKSKTCKTDPNDNEPMPCSPPLHEIYYTEVSRADYPSGEYYVDNIMGGMGSPPYQTIQGQGLIWIAGQAGGLVARPDVRAFAYDENKIRYLQLSTYALPYWEYTRTQSVRDADWSTAVSQTDWEKLQSFSYQIISTFKFIQ